MTDYDRRLERLEQQRLGVTRTGGGLLFVHRCPDGSASVDAAGDRTHRSKPGETPEELVARVKTLLTIVHALVIYD